MSEQQLEFTLQWADDSHHASSRSRPSQRREATASPTSSVGTRTLVDRTITGRGSVAAQRPDLAVCAIAVGPGLARLFAQSALRSALQLPISTI